MQILIHVYCLEYISQDVADPSIDNSEYLGLNNPSYKGGIEMYFSRRNVTKAIMVCCLSLVTNISIAQNQPVKSDDKRVALKGYDPVSYFTDKKPEQGIKEFTSEYDETVYWFKNADHRDQFSANPDKFAPQYDGFCAIALSKGKKVEADPLSWSIKNGKLYVFFGQPGVPVFKKEANSVIRKSKNNWPKLKNG